MKQMHCADCGAKISDTTYKNIDGEPCCRACWEEEERKLQV